MGKGVLTRPADSVGRVSSPAGFHRLDGALQCDAIPVDRLADLVGTPAYVYSASAIREQYRRLDAAFAGYPHRLHYSVKANSNLGVLALLRELGAGLDIVSGGELFRASVAGFGGSDIVFSGVGKTDREIEEALQAGVLLLNVESAGELERIDRIARAGKRRAPVALRVNPEVTVSTPHPYTRTGEKGMKFGIPYDAALEVARRAIASDAIQLLGLDMHIGSQISDVTPYREGLVRLLELAERVRGAGARELRYLDIGGGLAVRYDEEEAPDVDRFAAMMVEMVKPTGLTLLLEPGRFIVGNAGVLVTTVLDRKHSGGREYVITDAGMNDLLRPSHYHAFHRIEGVRPGGKRETVDIVGPVCESGDFFALGREIDAVQPGDRLVIFSAGAYGFVMASTYNSRPRPPEVMVDGERFAVVRERETYEDIVRHEDASPAWREAR